jgi:hypothetical protein
MPDVSGDSIKDLGARISEFEKLMKPSKRAPAELPKTTGAGISRGRNVSTPKKETGVTKESVVEGIVKAFDKAVKDAKRETQTTGRIDKFNEVIQLHGKIQKLAQGSSATQAGGLFAAFKKASAPASPVPVAIRTLAEQKPEPEKIKNDAVAAYKGDAERTQAETKKFIQSFKNNIDQKRRSLAKVPIPGKSFKLAYLGAIEKRKDELSQKLNALNLTDKEPLAKAVKLKEELNQLNIDFTFNFDTVGEDVTNSFERDKSALLERVPEDQRARLEERFDISARFSKADVSVDFPLDGYKKALSEQLNEITKDVYEGEVLKLEQALKRYGNQSATFETLKSLSAAGGEEMLGARDKLSVALLEISGREFRLSANPNPTLADIDTMKAKAAECKSLVAAASLKLDEFSQQVVQKQCQNILDGVRDLYTAIDDLPVPDTMKAYEREQVSQFADRIRQIQEKAKKTPLSKSEIRKLSEDETKLQSLKENITELPNRYERREALQIALKPVVNGMNAIPLSQQGLAYKQLFEEIKSFIEKPELIRIMRKKESLTAEDMRVLQSTSEPVKALITRFDNLKVKQAKEKNEGPRLRLILQMPDAIETTKYKRLLKKLDENARMLSGLEGRVELGKLKEINAKDEFRAVVKDQCATMKEANKLVETLPPDTKVYVQARAPKLADIPELSEKTLTSITSDKRKDWSTTEDLSGLNKSLQAYKNYKKTIKDLFKQAEFVEKIKDKLKQIKDMPEHEGLQSQVDAIVNAKRSLSDDDIETLQKVLRSCNRLIG